MNDDEPPMPPLPPKGKDGRYPIGEMAGVILARDIISRRRALGWSQAELARRARVRIQTVKRFEEAKDLPGVRALDKIACALDAGEKPTRRKRKS